MRLRITAREIERRLGGVPTIMARIMSCRIGRISAARVPRATRQRTSIGIVLKVAVTESARRGIRLARLIDATIPVLRTRSLGRMVTVIVGILARRIEPAARWRRERFEPRSQSLVRAQRIENVSRRRATRHGAVVAMILGMRRVRMPTISRRLIRLRVAFMLRRVRRIMWCGLGKRRPRVRKSTLWRQITWPCHRDIPSGCPLCRSSQIAIPPALFGSGSVTLASSNHRLPHFGRGLHPEDRESRRDDL